MSRVFPATELIIVKANAFTVSRADLPKHNGASLQAELVTSTLIYIFCRRVSYIVQYSAVYLAMNDI